MMHRIYTSSRQATESLRRCHRVSNTFQRARWVAALPPNPRLTSCAQSTINELFGTVVEPKSKHLLICLNIVVPVNAVRELFGDAQQQQLTPHIAGCVERVLALLIAYRHYDAINTRSDDALQRDPDATTHSLAGDESLADFVHNHETAQHFQDDYVARCVINTVDMLYTIVPSVYNRYYAGAMTLLVVDAGREFGAAERHADGRLPPLAMLRVGRILLLYYKRCEAYVNQDVLLVLLESVASVELAARRLHGTPQKRSRRSDVKRHRTPLRRASVRQSVVEVNACPSERRTMRSPSADPCACSKVIPSRRRSCITLLALLKKSVGFSCDATERFVYSNYYAYLTHVVYCLTCSVSVATTPDIMGRLYQLI